MKEIFENDNVIKRVLWWLDDESDDADLAGGAENAVNLHVVGLSVVPAKVRVVWPWVERFRIKIIPRFYVDSVAGNCVPELCADINSCLKQGADGAHVILKLNDLNRFVESVSPVRSDLFFNKFLSVGFDVFDIWPLDWTGVFDALKKLRANSLLLVLTHDDGDKSDFIGRIYGALENWDALPDTELHIMLGDSFNRAEQVYRLVEKVKPELLDKLYFWVGY